MRMRLACISVVLGWCSLASGSNVGNATSHSAEYNRTYSRNASTDADAVFYNPAATVALPEGLSASVSNTTILVRAAQERPEGRYDGTTRLPLYPSASISYRMGDWAVFGGASPVGTTGGATSKSGDGGTPHPLLIDAGQQLMAALPPFDGVNVASYDLSYGGGYYGVDGGIAYRLADWGALTIGARWVMAHYEIRADAVYELTASSLGGEPVAAPPIEIEAMASDSALSGMVGLFIEPADGWDVGIHYRHLTPIRLAVETERDNTGRFEDGSVIERDLPGYLSLGVGYEATSELSLMFSAEYYFHGPANWGKTPEGDELMALYDDGWVTSMAAQWQVDESWLLSLGYHFLKSGANDQARSATEFGLDKHSVATGFTYGIGSGFEATLGVGLGMMAEGADSTGTRSYSGWGVAGSLGVVKDIALSQVVPSGWEIHNERLVTSGPSTQHNFDYQDIRDDRIYTYFDLKRGESRSFNVKLNASYEGRFYMPQVSVEAMYDGSIYARDYGNWIEIIKPGSEG